MLALEDAEVDNRAVPERIYIRVGIRVGVGVGLCIQVAAVQEPQKELLAELAVRKFFARIVLTIASRG